MNTETKKRPFYKQPAIFIFTLFIAGFFLVQHYSNKMLTDAPLVLRKANPDIIMYSSTNCPYCYLAKSFFKKHNLKFIEYNVEESDKHREMFYILGGSGTPLIIINKQIIHGFDERLMREAL